MNAGPLDPRGAIDPRIDSKAREGLTGTAPAELFVPLPGGEQITIPPDFGPVDQQPAWRQDFPIDWPQDQYVERRDFMKFLVLTSFAMTLGQFWIAAQNWIRKRRGQYDIRRVASLDQVPVGGALGFTYPGEHDPCVLVRLADADVVAFSQKCTHLSCAVIPRPERNVWHCPCHEGLFDLRSATQSPGRRRAR
jgi:nitrite reductase/ring-hydroxylating ferredoxin subunit